MLPNVGGYSVKSERPRVTPFARREVRSPAKPSSYSTSRTPSCSRRDPLHDRTPGRDWGSALPVKDLPMTVRLVDDLRRSLATTPAANKAYWQKAERARPTCPMHTLWDAGVGTFGVVKRGMGFRARGVEEDGWSLVAGCRWSMLVRTGLHGRGCSRGLRRLYT